MTIDKSALLARAKADPVAFREETAQALMDARLVQAAAALRDESADLYRYAHRLRWMNSAPGILRALAHVEALAEALGVAL